MSKVYIGLGSNKGDRIGFLHYAVAELESDIGIKILALSSLYETKPYGVEDQPNYLNAVVLIETNYTPIEVYHKVKAVEKIVGRTKSKRWGEREIDLDIIKNWSEKKITEKMGQSDFIKEEGKLKNYQYYFSSCFLDVFLLKEINGYRVNYIQTRSTKLYGKIETKKCLKEISKKLN